MQRAWIAPTRIEHPESLWPLGQVSVPRTDSVRDHDARLLHSLHTVIVLLYI